MLNVALASADVIDCVRIIAIAMSCVVINYDRT